MHDAQRAVDSRYSRFVPWLLAGLVVAWVGGWPASVEADPLRMPRVGQQYLSVGGSLQPGFVHDRTIPGDPAWSKVSATGGGLLRLGFHQIVSRQLVMSGELDGGLQWMNEHTAETRGRADSETALTWQIAILGRWLPFGEREGWFLGVGPHYYNAYLDDRPLQSIGFDLRAGRLLWQSNEDFLLLEIGYSAPFVQGLTAGSGVRSNSSDSSPPPSDWTFHRFGLSFEYGF
jgi:hypothetical protein